MVFFYFKCSFFFLLHELILHVGLTFKLTQRLQVCFFGNSVSHPIFCLVHLNFSNIPFLFLFFSFILFTTMHSPALYTDPQAPPPTPSSNPATSLIYHHTLLLITLNSPSLCLSLAVSPPPWCTCLSLYPCLLQP